MNKEYEALTEKMKSEPVYLVNKFYDIVIRSTPGENGKFYAKKHGKTEFEIGHWTDLVHETIVKANEITWEEYENY